jgi:hypothetical protein
MNGSAASTFTQRGGLSLATPLDRALAYEPRYPAVWRHRNALITKLCHELGILPPWSTHVPRQQRPPS